VIAVLLDALVLGERLHWRTLVGGIGVMAGLAIAVSRPLRRAGSRPATG
jgi:drug/metabolite transporter (DMT)-like permease